MQNPIVLVVEDEIILRMAALAMLEDASIAAVGVQNSERALEVLAAYDTIRVVFTDVDLGRGRDGLWLAEQVRIRWPPIGIIVTSGHSHVTAERVPHGAVFLGKPYLEDRVLEEVRRLAA